MEELWGFAEELTMIQLSSFSCPHSRQLAGTCSNRLGQETGNWSEVGADVGLSGQSSDTCLSIQLLEYC